MMTNIYLSVKHPFGTYSRWYSILIVVSKSSISMKIHDFNPLVRHEAAQEMRVGPSKPVCRSWLQTTLSCNGKEPLW